MNGLGLLALLGFVLYNMVQQTPFHLDDFQQSILMMISFVGAVTLLERIFPTTRKTRREQVQDVPPWGTPEEHISNPTSYLPGE